jgi:hypothetical protein
VRRALLPIAAGLLLFPSIASAAAIEGEAERQPTNWIAIGMFALFVALTLWITRRAAKRTHTASDFYTAGGGITGFQNGLAMAGDYMSAASFLGISAQIFTDGFDGLISAATRLRTWPPIASPSRRSAASPRSARCSSSHSTSSLKWSARASSSSCCSACPILMRSSSSAC